MIALVIILAGFVLIAFGLTVKHHADRVLAEILAAEQRQIERGRDRGFEANKAARWQS